MRYFLIPPDALIVVRQNLRFHRRFDLIFSLDYEQAGAVSSLKLITAHNEVFDWVSDQFGESDAERWDTDSYDFGFRDLSDATAFRIRWG